jgi:hypothetical protein
MRGGRIERIEAHPDPKGRGFLRGRRDRQQFERRSFNTTLG